MEVQFDGEITDIPALKAALEAKGIPIINIKASHRGLFCCPSPRPQEGLGGRFLGLENRVRNAYWGAQEARQSIFLPDSSWGRLMNI